MSQWQEDEYGDEEEDEDFKQLEAIKDQTVFLVDASEGMFEPFAPKEDDGMKVSYFSYAVDMVRLFLKVKIFANPSDEFALVFYNTRLNKNDSSLEHVYTYLSLDLTDATRLKELEGLQDEEFREAVGSAGPSAEQPDALRMGLWAASQLLSKKTKSNKQVFLITREDQPCGNVASARDSTMTRAEELKHAQISLQFMPLPTPGRLFDMNLFWKALLEAARPQQQQQQEETEGSLASDVSSDFAYLHDYSHIEEFTKEDVEAITSTDLLRKKAYRRRAVARLRWTLVEGTSIAVQLYNLVQPCAKPQTINVSALTNEVLRTERRQLNAETAQMLTDQDKVTVFQPAANVSRSCFPDYVRMSREVVAAVKAVSEPGLKLLGFKPRDRLRDYHQAGHSSFVRPNEGEVKGSVTAFKALLAVMVQQDKIAICSYRRGKSSDTRLVALLPQQEIRDANGLQVFPEGMHLLQLPYFDDIRSPELEPSVVGAEIFRAHEEQVKAAGAMIDELTFPKDETGVSSFDCYSVRNPFLQRAYDAIELRATGKLISPLEDNPAWDETLPDMETMEARAGAIQYYKDCVYGVDGNIDGAKGTKRRAAVPADAAAADEAYLAHDWRALAASGLDKLTIPTLKLYLQRHKLAVSGNKKDLLERIRNHLADA